MRVREENCNMLLLAAVTAFSVGVAGVVSVMHVEPAPQANAVKQTEAMRPVHVADQTPTTQVRVIGTPFVPNTNPRER
jgi:hypothetical protein